MLCLNFSVMGMRSQGLAHRAHGDRSQGLAHPAAIPTLKPRIVICLEFADKGATGMQVVNNNSRRGTSSFPSSTGMSSSMAMDDDDKISTASSAPLLSFSSSSSPHSSTQSTSLSSNTPAPDPQKLPSSAPFVHRAIPKETRSLVKQVELSMVANRSAGSPCELHVTSWLPGGDFDHFSEYLNGGAWPIVKHQGELHECFPLDQVIMLSPDASEPLTHVENSKVYAIGGIVDRSVRKGITMGWSSRSGVVARRLPVQENKKDLGMEEGTSKSPVLNVSDVVQALVKVTINGGDWAEALRVAIPIRKKQATVQRTKKVRASNQGGRGSTASTLGIREALPTGED